MNHTPTPWQQGGFGLIYGPGVMPRIDGGLSHKEAAPVCEVKSGAFGTPTGFAKDETAKANAKLIVTACNAHEDLVKALIAIQAGFKDGSIKWAKKRQSDSDPYHPANTLMCEALAKAGVKSC